MSCGPTTPSESRRPTLLFRQGTLGPRMQKLHFPVHLWKHDRPFRFQAGGAIPRFEIAYETRGSLSHARDNVVVVLHALSGSSHAFASELNPEPGWWELLLEEGSPIDPRRHHIVCCNLLGGCYGSTGPGSIDPTTSRPYGVEFPPLTMRDIIEAHRLFLKGVGIDGPLTLIGGSMGGMLALEWAVRYPEEVRQCIALCAPARSYAQTIALRSVQRKAILSDPDWNGGDYYGGPGPTRGLALAREIGMITYRSRLEFDSRFGRDQRDARPHFLTGQFEVQSYLGHQGLKFVDRFDANTYLYYSRGMDLYDLSADFGSLEAALQRVGARTLLLAVSSDFLVLADDMRVIHEGLESAGRSSRFAILDSTHGHDAFLIESEQIQRHLREFWEDR